MTECVLPVLPLSVSHCCVPVSLNTLSSLECDHDRFHQRQHPLKNKVHLCLVPCKATNARQALRFLLVPCKAADARHTLFCGFVPISKFPVVVAPLSQLRDHPQTARPPSPASENDRLQSELFYRSAAGRPRGNSWAGCTSLAARARPRLKRKSQ